MLKKNVFTLVLVIVLNCVYFIQVNASDIKTKTEKKDQFPKYTNKRRKSSSNSGFAGYHQNGYHIFSGGLTSGYEYGSFAGMKGSYDYQVTDKISLGAQGNIYFLEKSLTHNGAIGVAVRCNYHFLDRGRLQKAPIDFYSGVGFGNTIGRDGWIKKDPKVELDWNIYLGLRYKIANNWILFTEIGRSSSELGLAFMLW